MLKYIDADYLINVFALATIVTLTIFFFALILWLLWNIIKKAYIKVMGIDTRKFTDNSIIMDEKFIVNEKKEK